MFVIEDEWHAEHIGESETRADALASLQKLAELPWNEAPNLCPGSSWQTCGRRYHIVEFDTRWTPWRQLGSEALLEVSAKETVWLPAT